MIRAVFSEAILKTDPIAVIGIIVITVVVLSFAIICAYKETRDDMVVDD